MSKNEEPIEIELVFISQTDDGYCCAEEEDEWDKEQPRIWLPKSIVEREVLTGRGVWDKFIMPQWLAEKKGLV